MWAHKNVRTSASYQYGLRVSRRVAGNRRSLYSSWKRDRVAVAGTQESTLGNSDGRFGRGIKRRHIEARLAY